MWTSKFSTYICTIYTYISTNNVCERPNTPNYANWTFYSVAVTINPTLRTQTFFRTFSTLLTFFMRFRYLATTIVSTHIHKYRFTHSHLNKRTKHGMWTNGKPIEISATAVRRLKNYNNCVNNNNCNRKDNGKEKRRQCN